MKNGYEKFFKEAQKSNKGPFNSFNIKAENPPAKGKPHMVGTPEDRLRRVLAERWKKRKERRLRKRPSFPVSSMLFAAVALVVCLAAYEKSDVLDQWLSKIEITALGQAGAAEDAKASAAKPGVTGKGEKSATPGGEKKENTAETKGAEKQVEVPSTKGWSQEEMSFFAKLNDRKKELDQREAELGKLEEELQKRKAELDTKLKQLESMRADISKHLKTRVANDQQKVDKLVQVYSSMKAQQAAKVIETLNEDLAIEVLEKLKKKNAAEILDMMNAKKARRLSELLTGYQRSTDGQGREPASAED